MDIFENICRTCGNDCLDAINIFEDNITVLQKCVPITQILLECLPANLCLPAVSKDDSYPKQICRVCIKKLTMIYEFNNKWQTANSEFNVALKFEQRRNRARNSQMQATSTADEMLVNTNGNVQLIEENIVLKHEPTEDNELETLICGMESELDTKSVSSAEQPSNRDYQCALCEERYHTLAAAKKHHKVSHRNCPYVYYIPEQYHIH